MSLATISPTVAERLGVTEDTARALERIREGVEAVGGSFKQDIRMPIVNGHGSMTSEKQTSWWVTLKGTATITQPVDGTTWTLKVTDVAQGRVVWQGSGIGANQPQRFEYKTGFTVQLQAAAWNSNPNENTTLVVHIEGSY